MATEKRETSRIRSSANPAPVTAGRSNLFVRLGVLGVVTLGAFATVGVLMACFKNPPATVNEPAQEAPSKELSELAGKYFRNWAGKKPVAVLVLTGEMHGFEEPCGCTRPQLGGLERRFWFMKLLREQGIEVIPLDLGDVYYDHFTPGRPTLPEQVMLKYKMSMKAMTQMDYAAVSVGQYEFRVPLLEALAQTVLNEKPSYRIVAANIQGRNDNFPGMIDESRLVGKNVKVGVIGTIGQSVIDAVAKVDKSAKFDSNAQVLPTVLKELNKQSPDLRVLLYQGTEEEALVLAKAIPNFDIILCLTSQSEPPVLTKAVGHTRIINIGHKGRYVGAVAVFRNADKSLDLKDLTYESVPLEEEFMTPKGQEAANPVLQLLEDYTKEVRDKDLLSKYPQVVHPMQVMFANPKPSFVGSKRCQECHKADYEKWDGSRHATSYDALETRAKRPGNRQFDGECLVCHTTGFGYETGYRDAKRTPQLQEVGCESCHGPASLHVSQPKSKEFAAALSPWKTKPNDLLPDPHVEKTIDIQTCQKCHDSDNDPKFKFPNFWPKIAHGKGVGKATKKDN